MISMADTSSKIDTQGMIGPTNPNYKYHPKKDTRKHKSMMVTPRRIHTPEMVKELKILINEVLDEREYKRRLAAAYDDVKPLPPSYFEVENFRHTVEEEEPPYEDWSQ